MGIHWVAQDRLTVLSRVVAASGSEIDHTAAAGRGLLAACGYEVAATTVAALADAAAEWADRWTASLETRVALLEDGTRVSAGSGSLSELVVAARAHAIYFATPASPGEDRPVGGRLALDLLDALEQQHLDDVEAILLRLQALDEEELVAFVERLGVDMVGLYPRLLVGAGVNPAGLATYLAPIGAALGVASRAEDGTALSFTGAEMMRDREGGALSPAAYFDFGDFAPDFLFAAASAVLGGFAEADLPLHGPAYRLDDGHAAGPDPRLPLLRAVLAADPGTQRAFLAYLAAQDLLPWLVSPATAWHDGGEAAGALLRSLVTGSDAGTMDTIAGVMRAIADAGAPAQGVALGSAVAIAPHLASLVRGTWFGTGWVTLEQTPLRASLDAMLDAGPVVTGFLAAVLAHGEARATLHTAFSALLAGTIAARLDPADSDSLAPLADDFAALWEALFGLSLQSDLDQARQSDAHVDMTGDAANLAVGYLLTGGASVIAATGFRAWAANVLGGAGLAGGPVEAMLGGTGDAERVLLDGFAAIHDAEAAAAAVLAVELHRRNVIELPAALLAEAGRVHLDGAVERALLADAFGAAGIDPTVWLNDIMAIFAYGLPRPR